MKNVRSASLGRDNQFHNFSNMQLRCHPPDCNMWCRGCKRDVNKPTDQSVNPCEWIDSYGPTIYGIFIFTTPFQNTWVLL